MSVRTIQSESGTERKSFGELFGQLLRDSETILHDEMELAKQEMREKVKKLQLGLVVIAIGAMVGQTALITLCAAAVIGLAGSIGFGKSALFIGVGLVLISAMIALSGLQQFRQADFKPQRIQTLKEGKKWLKRLT